MRSTHRNPPRVARPMPVGWVDAVLAEIRSTDWRDARVWGRRPLRVGAEQLELTVVRRDYPRGGAAVAWQVTRADGQVVAGGTGSVQAACPAVLQVENTAVVPAYQRRGLHTQVLRALHGFNGGPIESSASMTAGELAAWAKLGAVDADRDGDAVVRVNPRVHRNPPTPNKRPMTERWVVTTLAEPQEPAWRARAPWADLRIEDARGRVLRLIVKREFFTVAPGAVYVLWEVRDGQRTVAAGNAYRFPVRPEVLVIGASAVAPEDRRRGIYPRVLRVLRALNGGPIESDLAMTEGAVHAWNKLGAVDAKRHGTSVLRVNPTRTRRTR